MFGDAAAAVILSYDEYGESFFLKGSLNTYTEGVYQTLIKGGGNKFFFKQNPYNEELHSFKMDGRRLLKLAKKEMKTFTQNFFEDLDYSLEDVDVIIPHQTSKIGMLLFKKMYNFRDDQVMDNLSHYGNCIAASIPLMIHHSVKNHKLKRGALCLLLGTSAGFSIGATLFRY